MEKTGCGLIVGLAMAIVFALGIMAQCSRGQNQGANPNANPSQEAIATIGDFVITPAMVTEIADKQGQQNPDSSPNGEFQKYAQAIFMSVNAGVMNELAKKYGVTLSDEEIIKSEMSSLDQQLEMVKGQLVQQGKLKATATPAEYDAEIKKITGKTIAQLKDDTRSQISESLKDPQKRATILASKLNDPIRAKIESTLNPTDDEIKSQFRNYTVKQINFGSTDGNPKLKETAESVLKQIRGGMSFEDAITKYSKTPAQPGKKLADETQDVAASLVESYQAYKPLAKLKAGEVSDVVELPNSVVIYKLIKVTDNIPKDYDKSKENHKKSYLTSKASTILADEAMKIAQSGTVKWNSPGFKALYDYIAHMANPNAPIESTTEKVARLQALLQTAKEAELKDAIGARAATLARFVAMDDLWKNATPDGKDKLKTERMETLADVLQSAESIDLRLELADLLTEAKKGDEAFEQILAASRNNGDFTMIGQSNYGKIQKAAQKLIGLKLVTAEQQKDLETEQARWVTDKAEYDKEQAEMKKQQEEDAKRAAAEKKANEVKPVERGSTNKPSSAPSASPSASPSGKPGASSGAPGAKTSK